MSLKQLIVLMAPPRSPVDANVDWIAVEQRIGIQLPCDYKEFVGTYGTGCIDEFVWVFTPESPNKNLNLIWQLSAQTDALRSLRDSGEVIPYPVFPEPGGLIPFGRTDNGDFLYWICLGSSDKWSVAANESRGPTWVRYDLTITNLVLELLRRTIAVPFFPSDFPSDRASFRVRK